MGESSNFREGSNLVIRVKRLVLEGIVKKGSEVFVVTGNSVMESIFYKGSSKSSSLHDLIVGLRKLEIENQLIIHFCWVAGKRLIKMGVDGLSRGDFASGVMAGNDLLEYLPFNETALERHPPLANMIKRWTKGSRSSRNWEFLSING